MRFGRCGAPRGRRFPHATLARLTVLCLAAGACGGTPAPVLQPARPAPPTPTEPSAGAVTVPPQAPAPAQTGSVTGRVVTTAESAAPIARARVTLTSEALTGPRVVIASEDGSFRFEKVPPGAYTVTASASGFAQVSLQRQATDVPPITYEPVDTPPPPTFNGIRVRAPFADGTSFGDAVTGYVDDDGRYHIRGLMMGSHVVTVEGVPEPWVLKSVIWQGRDITDVAIEVDARERLEGVRVTLTDAASEIRGLVRDLRGRPVPDALVLMIPSSSQFWTRTSRRFGVLHTSDDGTYRLRGLPAGEYRAVATVEFGESEIYRKELLRDFAAAGRPLALHELQTVVLDLSLTSLSPVSRTLAR